MKNLRRMITAVMIMVLLGATPALASDVSDAVSIIVPAGAEMGTQAYVASVLSRMTGRCGSGTAAGAKGIAFEVLYSDLQNLKDFFTNAKATTMLSSCPNDPAADLVKVSKKTGEVVKKVQCKSGTSAADVSNTVGKLLSGQYEGVELVGTSEAAEAFNKKAEELGLKETMADSKIPNSVCEKIADTYLNASPALQAVKNVGKSTVVFAVFDAGVAAFESILEGYDLEDAIAHIVVGGGKGAILGTTAGLTTESLGFILLGASPAAQTVIPFVGMIGTTWIIGKIIDEAVEENGYEAMISSAVRKVREGTESVHAWIREKTDSLHISETFACVAETVKETAGSAKTMTVVYFTVAKGACEGFLDGIGECAGEGCTFVRGVFTGTDET